MVAQADPVRAMRVVGAALSLMLKPGAISADDVGMRQEPSSSGSSEY
jgi:hypothetical protein